MKFNKIDIENWKRKDTYLLYTNTIPCTYSICVNIDITSLVKNLKKEKIKFFPTFIYGISKIINQHKEFRMAYDENYNLGYYDSLNPAFTVFHEENENFTTVWTEYNKEFEIFYKNYNEDMKEYKNKSKESKPQMYKNIFHISCIPWTSFTGFNLNLQKGNKYLIPIFTIGKYFEDRDRILVPLALQVHHGVCDGFHTGRFLNDLQELFDNFIIIS